MRLILLTCLTMTAFAANSVLNRMAVDSGAIDPSSFAMIRILSGAVALCLILAVRGGALPVFARARVVGLFRSAVLANPALDKFPALFVGNFEILNHSSSNGFAQI